MGKSGGKPLTLTPGICLASISIICSEVACLVCTSICCFPSLISHSYSSTCVFLQIQNKLHTCESPFGEMEKKLSFRHNHWLRLCLVAIHHIIFINENFTEARWIKYSSSYPSQLVLMRLLTITLG